MDWLDSINRLEFDDHLLFNKQIGTVSGIDSESLVCKSQDHLTLDPQTLAYKLMHETHLIGRFKQARTQRAMNSNRGADDLRR